MTKYEKCLDEAASMGLSVKEKSLKSDADALINGNKIAVNKRKALTSTEKAWNLTEEIGHYKTGVGNIISQDTVENRKQERRGRIYAYNKCMELMGIVSAALNHCVGSYEAAEYLDVPETRLLKAIEEYKRMYGTGTMIDNYFIQFEPSLKVYEYIPLNTIEDDIITIYGTSVGTISYQSTLGGTITIPGVLEKIDQ